MRKGSVQVTQSSNTAPEHRAKKNSEHTKSRTLSREALEPKVLPGARPTSYGPPASDSLAARPGRETRVTKENAGKEKWCYQ